MTQGTAATTPEQPGDIDEAVMMISLFAQPLQRPGQALRLRLYAWLVGVRLEHCAIATKLGVPGRHRIVALVDKPVDDSYADCWQRQRRLVALLTRSYPDTTWHRYGD